MKGHRYFLVDLNKVGKGWVMGRLSEEGQLELLFDERFPQAQADQAAESLLLHVDGLVMSSIWPWEELSGEFPADFWEGILRKGARERSCGG